MPLPVSDDFIAVQDEYLREETRQKGITSLDDLDPIQPDVYLWQGDITTLACDAIVNAANSEMLAVSVPVTVVLTMRFIPLQGFSFA